MSGNQNDQLIPNLERNSSEHEEIAENKNMQSELYGSLEYVQDLLSSDYDSVIDSNNVSSIVMTSETNSGIEIGHPIFSNTNNDTGLLGTSAEITMATSAGQELPPSDSDDEGMSTSNSSASLSLSNGEVMPTTTLIKPAKLDSAEHDLVEGSYEAALHSASYNLQLHLCEYLLSQQANVHATDFHSLTPLHKALMNYSPSKKLRKNRLKVIKLLLDSGADVNASDEFGETPLWKAVECDNPMELVKYLSLRGADVYYQNVDGFRLNLVVDNERCAEYFEQEPIRRQLCVMLAPHYSRIALTNQMPIRMLPVDIFRKLKEFCHIPTFFRE